MPDSQNLVLDAIKTRLEKAFSPAHIIVRDESHLHIGHAGAENGGHFNVTVISQNFFQQSMLERHRMVYRSLHDMMQKDIHALSITTLAPEENPE